MSWYPAPTAIANRPAPDPVVGGRLAPAAEPSEAPSPQERSGGVRDPDRRGRQRPDLGCDSLRQLQLGTDIQLRDRRGGEVGEGDHRRRAAFDLHHATPERSVGVPKLQEVLTREDLEPAARHQHAVEPEGAGLVGGPRARDEVAPSRAQRLSLLLQVHGPQLRRVGLVERLSRADGEGPPPSRPRRHVSLIEEGGDPLEEVQGPQIGRVDRIGHAAEGLAQSVQGGPTGLHLQLVDAVVGPRELLAHLLARDRGDRAQRRQIDPEGPEAEGGQAARGGANVQYRLLAEALDQLGPGPVGIVRDDQVGRSLRRRG